MNYGSVGNEKREMCVDDEKMGGDERRLMEEMRSWECEMGSRKCESQRRKQLGKKRIYLVFDLMRVARSIKDKMSKTENEKSMKRFFFKDFCVLCLEGGEEKRREEKKRREEGEDVGARSGGCGLGIVLSGGGRGALSGCPLNGSFKS